ncbi:MAG: PilT/PilU family type 4a pilus ATPase [Opitutales bacterium]|nr:PilT/PilU family type 4a pilus ATPase [Opitutales bacterium]
MTVTPYFEELISLAVNLRASDVHVVCRKSPSMRIDGTVTIAPGKLPVLSAEETEQMLLGLLSDQQRKRLEADMEIDFGLQVSTQESQVRLRVNMHYQRFGLAAVFRMIPQHAPTPEAISLEPSLIDLKDLPGGLVLVTGATGMGKSTTVASLINAINSRHSKHILTIEDPIEYYFEEGTCRVTQREIDSHTHSFASALRSALRANPNIIFVGEMRDLETIALALTAAETGHLVFSTLHTPDVAHTLHRIIDVFPSAQQSMVRAQLASCLQAVVGQVLIPCASGEGRAAAREILLANAAVRTHIREGEIHQIYPTLCSSIDGGMCPLELALARQVNQGIVDYTEALNWANHRSVFESYIRDKAQPRENAKPDSAKSFQAFSAF